MAAIGIALPLPPMGGLGLLYSCQLQIYALQAILPVGWGRAAVHGRSTSGGQKSRGLTERDNELGMAAGQGLTRTPGRRSSPTFCDLSRGPESPHRGEGDQPLRRRG